MTNKKPPSASNQQASDKEKRLEDLLQANSSLWKGAGSRFVDNASVTGFNSGYPALDAILPWGGWPRCGIVEIISPQQHIGELRLVMPLLRSLSQQQCPSVWITPPYTPYAPALLQAGIALEHVILIRSGISWRETLWSLEKSLQTRDCSLVLAWLRQLNIPVLRRLQLAAQTGHTLGIIFHQRQITNSPSALRLMVTAATAAPANQPGTLAIRVVKARGCHRQHTSLISIYE